MLLTEYNEAETMELFKEEGRMEGRAEGRAVGRLEGRAEGRLEGRAEGRAEGRLEGEDRLGTLIARLISANRTDDITRVVSEPDYRKRLYAEYGI